MCGVYVLWCVCVYVCVMYGVWCVYVCGVCLCVVCVAGGNLAWGRVWVHVGMDGEAPVPVVLVSWKVIALSGMPHTLRTDTWQV